MLNAKIPAPGGTTLALFLAVITTRDIQAYPVATITMDTAVKTIAEMVGRGIIMITQLQEAGRAVGIDLAPPRRDIATRKPVRRKNRGQILSHRFQASQSCHPQYEKICERKEVL